MAETLANVEIAVTLLVVALSVILAGVSFLTYRRLGRKRVLVIGWAFLGFAAKGGYLFQEAWAGRGDSPWLLTVAGFDLFILLLLYAAVRVR